jgi:nucleolin
MSVEDDRKLFVAGLADAVTEDILRQLFEAAGGDVQSVTIPVDRATGKPRGFAFVTMASSEQAGAVRQALDGTLQAGRSISVRLFRADRNSTPPSRGQGYQPEESTLYVGNLPFDSSAAELEEALGAAGVTGIQRIHLPMDADGRFRGFGFVVLSDAAAANQATLSLQQAAIRGRALSVSVARARGAQPGPTGGRSAQGRLSAPPPSQAPPSSRTVASSPGASRPTPRDFRAPEPPKFESLPPSSRTARPARWDKDKDKEKGEKKWDAKKKKNRPGLDERGPKRRQNEGFRTGRHDELTDWDDE